MDRAAAIRPRLVHLLEPERRVAVARVDQVLVRAVRPRVVAKDRSPERHHRGGIRRSGDEEGGLHRRRVGSQPQFPRRRRDLASDQHVTLGHPAVLGFLRDQADGHAVGPHVDSRRVIVDARELPDRLNKPGARCEGSGREEGAGTLADDAPVIGAACVLELLRRDVVGHAGTS